jgi:hypothetical protein
MRRVIGELDKRVRIVLDKSIIDGGVNGVMNFGAQNNYPQMIERIIGGSISAKAIAKVKTKFLIGDGFQDERLSTFVIGKDSRGKDYTLSMLVSQLAYELAIFNGCYIHRNITLEGIVKNARYIPFKYCRFAKPDDNGYSAKVCVYENWEKDPDAVKKFDKSSIKTYHVFSTNKEVITAQINGDLNTFCGQLNYLFFDNQYLYPLSPVDVVYMDADSEGQVALYKNNQLRNGLLDKILLRVAPSGTDKERQDFVDTIKKALGADGDPVICLEDEIDPLTNEIKQNGAFKMDSVKSNINDTLFESWETSFYNNIRKAYDALPAILIDYVESSLGTTSGEAIQQAVSFYNAMTRDERKALSNFLKETFQDFESMPKDINWDLKELSLIKYNPVVQ